MNPYLSGGSTDFKIPDYQLTPSQWGAGGGRYSSLLVGMVW
jgi:hypothetical protein